MIQLRLTHYTTFYHKGKIFFEKNYFFHFDYSTRSRSTTLLRFSKRQHTVGTISDMIAKTGIISGIGHITKW